MIYNVLGTDAEYRGETTAFVDDNSISEYAYNAVYAMKHMGLINGYENGEFSPLGYLTRAEATKVLYMVLDYLK